MKTTMIRKKSIFENQPKDVDRHLDVEPRPLDLEKIKKAYPEY